MGCIGSRLTDVVRRSGRANQNLFSVLNVDEMGRHISPGKLEVTETDLVLHIRGKAPLTWPLRCLRRYGYEEDLFSFESGRRCPTGAGIYAFKCTHAQGLFNLLQARIQGNSTGLPQNLATPLSPTTNPPLALPSDYVNVGEERGDDPGPARAQPLYINVENESSSPGKSHRGSNGTNWRRVLGEESVYQNCGGVPNYGNVELQRETFEVQCVEVNYAELDLEIERDLAERTEEKTHLLPRQSTLSETPPLDPPNGELGYATIDFDRTAALSVVATRSKMKLDIKDDDTTTRRTRHNSTAL